MSEGRARPLIEPHLWSGEELLWCDQPVAAGPVAKAAARRGFYGSFGAAVGVIIFTFYARGAFGSDPPVENAILVAGLVVAACVVAFGTLVAWSRARRIMHLVAYGLTNRRIIMVLGEELHWTGLRELEEVRRAGDDVVVRRRRTETEQLWANQGEGRQVTAKADSVAREVTLAALPNAQQVVDQIQTLIRTPAS